MADLLQQASEWLQEQLKSHMSQPVTYSRGIDQITINATLGKTHYEVEDQFGLRVKAEVMDFLVAADELIIAGKQELPDVGDQVRIQRGDATHVFEVMSLGDMGHWQYSDAYGRTFRIHTRQVDTE